MTYLNIPGSAMIAAILMPKHATYIIVFKKLNGLHILNNAMNPIARMPIDAIVTKTSVVIPVYI